LVPNQNTLTELFSFFGTHWIRIIMVLWKNNWHYWFHHVCSLTISCWKMCGKWATWMFVKTPYVWKGSKILS
jgi:hypothetical protein